MEHPLHATFVIVYLLVLIGVGALKAGKIKTQADFSLAGRGLPTFVLVGTLLATWIGTGSIFGNAQKTFQIGVGAFLLPVGSVLGILVLFRLAARIRRLEQVTIQDILEARFGVGARLIGTVALLLAYVIIVSYQYRAGSAVLQRIYPDLGDTMAICVVAIFVIVYTALAGMFSVAYTDVANGVLMVIGILVALPILWLKVGGAEGLESLPTGHLSVTSAYTVVLFINWVLPPMLLILGDANMYQRFFSAKDPGTAKRSAFGMLIGVAIMECAIIAVALLGRALVEQGQIVEPDNPGHIVVSIAFEALPTFLGAMLMGTIVAIVVSTADSYLLAPSTSVVRDVYKRFLKPAAGDGEVVLVGRGVVVILGLAALGLAFSSEAFFEVALFAYTVYGASITPVMLAAFFWPRATKAGAVTSMLTGIVVALAWQAWQLDGTVASWSESLHWPALADMDAVIPSLLLSVLALVGVSLAGKRPQSAALS